MKKKVKIWMICSYCFVLAVFLMIYLAIQQETEKKLRELYIEKQLAVMNQTILAADEQVEAMTKLCLGIIQEPYVQYFPFVGEELDRYATENVTKLLNNIRKHYTADPFVEDFYLFYENSGRIANANGFYRESDFYRMEWSYEDDRMQRQVQEQLRQKGTMFLPAAWMENGVRRVEIITFFYDFGRTAAEQEGKSAKLVLLLKKAWLDDMVRAMAKDGMIRIQRASDGVELYRYQGNDELQGFQREDSAALEYGGDPGHVLSWNGKTYLITCLNSEKTGWIYESVLPYSIITSQMRDAVRPMSAGLFWYLLVGIPACILMAVWNYAPIQQLTSHMESMGFPKKLGHQNEVEYIRSGISNLHKKYEELERKYGSVKEEFDSAYRKLRKNRERIQEGLLFQLISGYWRDDQEIAERLQSVGIAFHYPKFCLVTIQIEEDWTEHGLFSAAAKGTGGFGRPAPESEGSGFAPFVAAPDAKEKSLRLFVLKNVAQEYLQPFGQVFPVPGSSEQLYLLMNLSENGYVGSRISPELEALMRQMMEYFRREMQISISIGVGTLCSQIHQLSDSRRRSRQALEYCFIIGRSSLVIYDPKAQEEGKAYRFDERIEKQLLGGILQRDERALGELLDQLYEDALKHGISVNEGKRLHMFLADVAMKAIGRSNAEPALEERCQDMVAAILSSPTLPEVLPLMKELFVILCTERKKSGGELEETMLNYITEHYWELDFSLQMCAEHFGVSPEHFSRTIKAVTGRKFIEIVNQLRLERAKRYLLETDKKMEEVAELSGYGTAKSFFRSFKQAEGVPPGVWRKQMKGEE